jgi:predicted TIM-barrel fold metal-dependent hydrolase
MRCVDAHTNIGEDLVRKKLKLPNFSDPELLAKLSKENGISDVIVVPSPGQIVCPCLGISKHPDIFVYEDIFKLISSEEDMQFSCICGQKWKIHDPFEEVNEYLFNTVKHLNERNNVVFHPLPIIHPLKRNVEKDIENYYDKYQIKGIKINPKVDKTNPLAYSDSELVDTIKRLNLRVLFHSDVTPSTLPNSILDFAQKTGTYCQIAHACRADEKALKRSSNLSNVIVDISPLNMIENKNRLFSKKDFNSLKEFAKYIIDSATEDKVVAASDYYWCGWTPESYTAHWKVFKELGSEKVLYRNASRFWNLE